jgi:hypothetical protein
VEEVLRKDTANGGMQTTMENVVAQMTAGFVFRRTYHEKVWKRDAEQVIYDKIAWRPPDTCTVIRNKKTGDLDGFAQYVIDQPNRVHIYLPYALVYVHGQHREPVKGMSDLTVCYHNYRTKEKLKFLWYMYCEVMSLPRTIVFGNSNEGAKKAVQAIAALKNAGVAGIPKDWVSPSQGIQPLPSSTAGAQEFQQAIGYLDSDSALSLLAGFTDLPGRAMGTGVGMSSGSGSRGSYGLNQSSQQFFLNLLTAYTTELSACLTDGVVSDLVTYNKGRNVQIPRFSTGELEAKDVSQSFALLQSMATAPKNNLPIEFLEQLTLVVADQLGMDTDVISQGFSSQEFKDQQQQQQMQSVANVGQQVAQEAQRQGAGQQQPQQGAEGSNNETVNP